MTARLRQTCVCVAATVACGSVILHAQQDRSLAGSIRIANHYRVAADVTYLTVGGVADTLDVYQSRDARTPRPTLIFIHGGNWVGGSKTASSLMILPFLDMGWNVVNIDYRLLRTAPAPAGADDCFCALRWVYQHARDYNIDTSRLVVSGNSAGGQLALLLAMAPPTAGFGADCPGPEALSVSGVINWYGFSDSRGSPRGPRRPPRRPSVDRRRAEPRTTGPPSIASNLRQKGQPADSDDSGRRGPNFPVPVLGSPARRTAQGRRAQPTADDPGREARRLYRRGDRHDLPDNPAVSERTQSAVTMRAHIFSRPAPVGSLVPRRQPLDRGGKIRIVRTDDLDQTTVRPDQRHSRKTPNAEHAKRLSVAVDSHWHTRLHSRFIRSETFRRRPEMRHNAKPADRGSP